MYLPGRRSVSRRCCHGELSYRCFGAAFGVDSGRGLERQVCDLVSVSAHHENVLIPDHPGAAKSEWVRGYRSGEWHDARQAYYVHGPRLQTPMGGGLIAYRDPSAAGQAAGRSHGEVVRSLEELLRRKGGRS